MNYYQLLGIPEDASHEEIMTGFATATYALEDKNQEKIYEAFAVLSDPVKRREYDQNKKQIENDPNYTIRVEDAMLEKVYNENKKRSIENAKTEQEKLKQLGAMRKYLNLVDARLKVILGSKTNISENIEYNVLNHIKESGEKLVLPFEKEKSIDDVISPERIIEREIEQRNQVFTRDSIERIADDEIYESHRMNK